jgi:outer membrane lipoprotein-sorting protein
MLRKLYLSVALVLFLTPALLAQTVDEIIAKSIEARGGLDKIKAVKSIKMTGKMAIGPGIEAPISMVLKRPDQMRMELTVQGLTMVRAYDGKSGWGIMPFTGKKDPEAVTADELKELEDQADIDGPLVDYKSKGHSVELLGKEKVEGTDAYKLKVIHKNGDIDIVYLDADAFLEIKEEGKRNVRGTEQETETSFADYREIEGMMFSFAIEGGQKGNPQRQKITIEKLELNVPVEDASFKMPAPAPAPAPAAAPAPASPAPAAAPAASKAEEKKEPPKN